MRIEGRTDGQRDMANLIVAFSNFKNALKNDMAQKLVTQNIPLHNSIF
jgi:hypothetical protein